VTKKISKFNAEGYHDPTPHEALTNISKEEKKSKFRPLVYIASPFSGDMKRNAEGLEVIVDWQFLKAIFH